MTLLLTQIFFCLLIAAVIGALAAWFYSQNVATRREEIIQQDWKDRVRQIELERDRTINKLSTDLDGANRSMSESGRNVALADYENLANKLQGQVAEREDAIGELRSEIQSLRSELTEAWASARQRESSLLQQHEQETANLIAQLEHGDSEVSSESAAASQQYEQEIARLNAQLAQRNEQALSEREDALRHHEQEIAGLKAQLVERDDQASGAGEEELRLKYEQEIAGLKTQLADRDEQVVGEIETASQQHEQEVARLNTQLEQRDDQAWTEIESALQQKYETEIAQLKEQLEQRGQGDWNSEGIEKLQAEIKLRDDSIAVLRDDLAALSEQRAIDHRGRQDEQLRVAIDESITWQEKYEAAATELAQRKAADSATVPVAAKTVVYPELDSDPKSERASGDRIGSVLSHPGGPKDRLQEIKGIGPVLERKLNDVGVYHFRQIAEFDADDIARISNELGRFANRITRDEWVRQAKTLHKKYHT